VSWSSPWSAATYANLGRIPSGKTDALPALAGLIALCAFLGLLRPAFFSPGNVANLFTQGAAVSTIAMGRRIGR